MFQKKSNRNFRQKRADSDDEDESAARALEEAKAANVARAKEKLKSKVLSFKDDMEADEDAAGSNDSTEAAESFKVKKSKESRRISKEMKRLKKEKERQLKEFGPSPPTFNQDVVGRVAPKEAPKETTKARYLVNRYGGAAAEDEASSEENGEPEQDEEETGVAKHDEDHDEKLKVRALSYHSCLVSYSLIWPKHQY